MDDLNFDIADLSAALTSVKTFDELESVLNTVAGLTPRVFEPAYFGRSLFTRGLDAGLMRIARALQLEVAPPPKSNAKVAIVASQFYTTGGHTRVARDFARILGPDNRPLIVLSNMGDGSLQYRGLLNVQGLKTQFDEAAMLIAQAPTRVERIIEVFTILKAAGVSRIVLMCHPFDVVAITACWPFRDIVDFAHHCDHVAALGAAMEWSAHVDLTYSCHHACRGAGLKAVYAGMTSPVIEAPPHIREPGRLRMATCGDQRKYVGKGRFRWADWAVAAMRLPGAEMRHIGAMTPEFRQEVHSALADAGLDPARYTFPGVASSLPADLVEHNVDVFVGSYPVHGGKANLEAMLASVPVVLPFNADLTDLMSFTLPLRHYVDATDPDGLAEAVDAALAMGATLDAPDARADRTREIARFTDFVANRPLSPA